jgi:LPXTG-motif cell wall-anchored protein
MSYHRNNGYYGSLQGYGSLGAWYPTGTPSGPAPDMSQFGKNPADPRDAFGARPGGSAPSGGGGSFLDQIGRAAAGVAQGASGLFGKAIRGIGSGGGAPAPAPAPAAGGMSGTTKLLLAGAAVAGVVGVMKKRKKRG